MILPVSTSEVGCAHDIRTLRLVRSQYVIFLK
jgi:hypothetical protein